MIVSGGAAERLLIDQLAEAVEEGRIFRRDRNPRQIGFQTKGGKLLGGVRQKVDADADRADFGRGLEYAAGNPGRMQRKTKVKPPMPPPTIRMSSMFPPRIPSCG